MALPVTFAGLTTPTGLNLDQNFAALGALTPIPCTAAGTNTVTMTPAANTPTISAYADGNQFSGVAANTNTSAVTAQIGSLPALNVYKDSLAGPVALTGGEIIASNAFTLRYDAALNSGAGGFHLFTNTGFAGGTVAGPIVIGVSGGSVTASLSSANLSAPTLTGRSLATVTKLMVGASAASLTRLLSALGTVTFTATPANSAQDQTFALPGALIRDSIALGLGTSTPGGAGFTGYMVADGTVNVRLVNPAVASIAGVTMTVRATAMGFT